jgi:hypothetical protein
LGVNVPPHYFFKLRPCLTTATIQYFQEYQALRVSLDKDIGY